VDHERSGLGLAALWIAAAGTVIYLGRRRLLPTKARVTVMVTAAASGQPRRRRFLGLRHAPGRLALWVFRIPLILYRRGGGRLLGRTLLMFVHVGRKTGRRHEAVAMLLADDPATHELVICSGWGPEADWVHNLHAAPAAAVQIGRDRFVATRSSPRTRPSPP
jgi:deazaflavin-dependent oxidoreductase (nitroreductase family)